MADKIGNIVVPVSPLPTPATSINTFPLFTDYTWSRTEEFKVAIHRFLSDTAAKTEQRYLLANPGKIFTFRKGVLATQFGSSTGTDKQILATFWEYIMNQGGVPFALFNYLAPNEDGTTTNYVVRFLDPSITFDGVIGSIFTSGVQFIEVIDPATAEAAQTFSISATLLRFPNQTLIDSWLQPTVSVIPVLQIFPKTSMYPPIYVSDRRCNLGGQVYQARIIKRGPIELTTNAESSPFVITLGNADSVFTLLAHDTNLFRADVQFSLFDINTGILLNLWRGYINDFSLNEGSEFPIQCVEGAYELTLAYPKRIITRNCYRTLDNALTGCPWSTTTVIDPNPTDPFYNQVYGRKGNPTFCDKGFNTANGCVAHNMMPFFGGIIANPETIRVLDNTTGVWGIGRNKLSVTSQISSTIYNLPLQEIYTDFDQILNPATGMIYTNPDITIGFPINCLIASGTNESGFYQALGIVCAGPIGMYAQQTEATNNGVQIGNPQAFLIDGQPQHGWPNNPIDGIWTSLGSMPALPGDGGYSGGASQWFGLEQGSGNLNDFGQTPTSRASFGPPAQTGGVAHVNLRRTAVQGLELDTLDTHTMQAVVRQGLGGYKWTAPGSNTFTTVGLSEPIWVMVNIFLRALGYWGTPPTSVPLIADQEQFLDVPAAVYASTMICDLVVPVLVGGNPGDVEIQYLFQGIIGTQQSLKDWLVAVANTFLGGFTIAFGQLSIFVRENSSAQQAFSLGNIILGSQNFGLLKPEFNRITGNYADQLYGFVGNTSDIYDEIYSQFAGSADNPYYLPTQLNLVGVTNMSQAARLVTTRLREEISGYGSLTRTNLAGDLDPYATFVYGKQVSFSTALFAIICSPGMVCRLDTPQAPDLPPTDPGNTIDVNDGRPNCVDFRIKRMVLNEDYSIDINGPTTHRDNYALVAGPKPADVAAAKLPDQHQEPTDWGFNAFTYQDGWLQLGYFRCRTNFDSVTMCLFDIYYIDETTNYYSTIQGGVPIYNSAAVSFSGDVDSSLQIQIIINDNANTSYTVPTWLASDNGIDSSNTPSDVVASLIIWLNNDPGFMALYQASGSTSNLFILDTITHTGGEIQVNVTDPDGSITTPFTATSSNFGTLEYFGIAPTSGQWIMVGTELMFVLSVTTIDNLNGFVQVTRGVLGTIAKAHPEITTSLTLLPDTNLCGFQMGIGLELYPGSYLVDTPDNQAMLASYDKATGIGYILRPFPRTTPGSAYQDPRMWNVRSIQHMTSFPTRFFRSAQRASFVERLWMPALGIVSIVGILKTNSGLSSLPFYTWPIGDCFIGNPPLTHDPLFEPYYPFTEWPFRARTSGQERFVMEADYIATNQTDDAFTPIPASEPDIFSFTQLFLENGDGTPLPTPSAISSIAFSHFTPSGKITIGGIITANSAIQVTVKQGNRGGNEILASTWIARNFGITSSSSYDDVAQKLTDWLNNSTVHPDFANFYTAINLGGGIVQLQDNFGWGGFLNTLVTPNDITATCFGFASIMGVFTGRRYATAFTDGTNISALSLPSPTTGPTGDADSIIIQNLPTTDDPRVTGIYVYALTDGQSPYGPAGPMKLFRLISPVLSPGTAFIDTMTEVNLDLQYKFNGPIQSGASDIFLAILTKDELEWAFLNVPKNSNVSNYISGYALDPISKDTSINANLTNNNAAPVTIFLDLQ